MDLKEGMYVRTKDGYIDKIVYIELAEERRKKHPSHPSKNYWRDKIMLSNKRYWQTKCNIVKANYNIIDLIEVGDYVNGYKVLSINIEGKFVILDNQKTEVIYGVENIKSILTHEQFEREIYKI